MAQKPETLFTGKVLKRLRTEFPGSWFTKIMAGSIVGIPDIIGCHKGLIIAWELKVGRNHPTRIQMHVLDQIRRAGGIGEVITPENFELALSELKGLHEKVFEMD